jgi:nicotinate phosphoribosyltransferase
LRRHKDTGTALEEVVFQASAAPELGQYDRLVQLPLMRAGQLTDEVPTLEQSRERLRAALVSVPWEGLKLSRGEPAIPTTYLEG